MECIGDEFEEKIFFLLMSNKLLIEEEGEIVRKLFRVFVYLKKVNNVLSEFLY